MQFVNAFRRAKTIASNILVHSDKKCTKIYEGTRDIKPTLHDFLNFWPDPEDGSKSDRQMLISQMNACTRHRRLVNVFNYPRTNKPKMAFFIPYFSDNQITLSRKENQACWITHSAASDASLR